MKHKDSTEILEAIQIALPVFAEHKDSEWETLAVCLKNTNISDFLVDRLLEFMPLAFGRVFMDGMGAQFDSVYIRYDVETERESQYELTDNLVFKVSFEVASYIVDRKMVGDAFVAVMLRSPEFAAVNELMNKGSKPEDILLSSPYLHWLTENE